MSKPQASVSKVHGRSTPDGVQADTPEVPAAEEGVPVDSRRSDSSMLPDADVPDQVSQKWRPRLRAFFAAVRGRRKATSSAAGPCDSEVPEAGDQATCCSDTERAAQSLRSNEAAALAPPASKVPDGQHPGAVNAQEQRSSISSSGGRSGKETVAGCNARQQGIQEGVDWAEMNNSMMHSLHHLITGIIMATIARVCAFSPYG